MSVRDLDVVLVFLLLAVLPGTALWRSWRADGRPLPPKRRRYGCAMLLAAGLTGILAADWWHPARSLAGLGLAAPVTIPALAGLAVAALLLAAAAVTLRRQHGRSPPPNDLLPETAAELALFVPFCLIIGFAWELLYRGYLLWALSPHIGAAGAVLTAALAYALAHGFKSWRSFGAGLLSAVLFTIGYALTGSLWWLMLIHAGLPLLGAIAVQRGAGVDATATGG